MLGVGGMNMGNDADALNVMLYPDIVSSTPFILDLMDTRVRTMDEEQADTTLVGYLEEYTSSSLIGTVTSLPFKAISGILSLFKSEEEEKEDIHRELLEQLYDMAEEHPKNMLKAAKKVQNYLEK